MMHRTLLFLAPLLLTIACSESPAPTSETEILIDSSASSTVDTAIAEISTYPSYYTDSVIKVEQLYRQLYPTIVDSFEFYVEDSVAMFGHYVDEDWKKITGHNFDVIANHEDIYLLTVRWQSDAWTVGIIEEYFFVKINDDGMEVLSRPNGYQDGSLTIDGGTYRVADPELIGFIAIADETPAAIFEQMGSHGPSGFMNQPRFVFAPIDGKTKTIATYRKYRGYIFFSMKDDTPEAMAETLANEIDDLIPNEMYRDDIAEYWDSLVVSNTTTNGFYDLIVYTDTCAYVDSAVICGSSIDTLRWHSENGTY